MMRMIENIWLLIALVLNFFVLSTDPKASSGGSPNNNLNMLFSSVSDGQKSLRNVMWFLVACFYLLSLVIN